MQIKADGSLVCMNKLMSNEIITPQTLSAFCFLICLLSLLLSQSGHGQAILTIVKVCSDMPQKVLVSLTKFNKIISFILEMNWSKFLGLKIVRQNDPKGPYILFIKNISLHSSLQAGLQHQ